MNTLHTEPSTNDPPLAEVSLLLADYLDEGRSEAAFAQIVERAGGMVYGSALRRTGDAHLAEEVTQNVFTVLARKASSLRRHPSLAAWIFQTTRYEASKAMRAENRRRKKIEALAAEMARAPQQQPEPGEEVVWQAALPALYESLDYLSERERALVLERFFEGRKFSEIAVKTGRSEAACKMGIKRTLEKLSRFLTSRGVTLSATAVASVLTTEFARSAPLQTLAAIAPKALATSGGLTATSLITNTVQTMSTLKSATLTGAAVLAVASVPFMLQSSDASKLRAEFASLSEQRVTMSERLVLAKNAREARAESAPVADPQARTIGDLLAAAEAPINLDELMRSMMEVLASRDMVGIIRVFLPIAHLDKEEYEKLMAELQDYQGNAQMKGMAMEMLGSFAPTVSPKESLERMMALDLQPHAYSNLLSQWAKDDPDAAFAWYMEKRESGALVGKGVLNTPETVLLGELARGLAAKDPARALDLFQRFDDGESRNQMINRLAEALSRAMKKSGDPAAFERYLAMVGEGGERTQSITIAVRSQAEGGNLEQGQIFIEEYLEDPRERGQVVVNMLANERNMPLEERGKWLRDHIAPEHLAESVGHLVQRLTLEGQSGVDDWLETQPAGAAPDAGYRARALSLTNRDSIDQARAAALRIEDPALRANAETYLERQGQRQNPQ